MNRSAWSFGYRQLLLGLLICLSILPLAHAQLVVAQHSSLNVVDKDAFMVISLPTSAFQGVDDDADGLLSRQEFTRHERTIKDAVRQGVRLINADGSHALQELHLTPSPSDESRPGTPSQVVAMGHFSFNDPTAAMQLQVDLFGTGANEQSQLISVTRPADGRHQLLTFSSQEQRQDLFTSRWATFTNYLKLGTEHIVTGFDHLLFLLVVLITGWGWRHIVLALSVFTLGHAVTLSIGSLYGLSLAPAIIAPAIAVTIIGMSLYDLISRQPCAAWIRLTAVFACALIHGLGLASALIHLGPDKEYLLTSLTGFNLGIEFGQLLAAMLLVMIAKTIRHMLGEVGLALASRTASILAIGMGSIWFVQGVS